MGEMMLYNKRIYWRFEMADSSYHFMFEKIITIETKN